MLLYNLRFAWWNVSLSPPAKTAKSNSCIDSYSLICGHIKNLLIDNSCDFIALCEVSESDFIHIAESLIISDDISFLDLTSKVGRTRFDMMVIYKKSKISVEHEFSLSQAVSGQTVKGGQLVKVENLNDSKIIYVYLCHWASRLNGDSEKRRVAAANMVYSSAYDYMRIGHDVIVMGDFNDNPYDDSMYKFLRASRCHDAVRKYPDEYFYNPFWRTIVSNYKYSHLNYDKSYRSGSYKYKQFSGEIWHSYDQIVVSGSFLTGKNWHLNEFRTEIMQIDDITLHYDDAGSFVDHLPVVCEITRRI
ncbi:endonuclease/exonuclease/phosphatase [Photobacterium angustum]|uniref:endonuclease/exonuclease/phosphatase family protein n=1 Tax=Photobacterium angustum TaxID=661 RepID=UPI0005DC636A|nr:endonuclease/exonuclease/phosphatase family protein [Photobacterium angustum]KJG29180.1 hypothetical protein UA69_15070 [Photobacterium angustum]PSW91428.1 endonuclease/exonuclease/phosphatase [Photobacterium angustum]